MNNQDYALYILAAIGAAYVIYHVIRPVVRHYHKRFNNWFWLRVNRERVFCGALGGWPSENSLEWHIRTLTNRVYDLEQKLKEAK